MPGCEMRVGLQHSELIKDKTASHQSQTLISRLAVQHEVYSYCTFQPNKLYLTNNLVTKQNIKTSEHCN